MLNKSVHFPHKLQLVCVLLFEQKRYSLQAGPPKKDPKSKGVNPAAVQALLKKQVTENKKKGINDLITVKFLMQNIGIY